MFLVICSGLGATLNVAKPKKGSTVAVFGMGAVGLAVSFLVFSAFFHIDTFTACV
jgi:Zn-dependent alcohol dehydrogenase